MDLHAALDYSAIALTLVASLRSSVVMAKDHVSSRGNIPVWNELASSMPGFEQQVKMYVMGTKKDERYLCAPRMIAAMDPESQSAKLCQALTETQLTEACGKGCGAIRTLLKTKKGGENLHEAVKLLKGITDGVTLYRQNGEGFRNWST